MRLTAVVLDEDGTLVDSERDGHRVAFNQAFEEFGMPDRWDEEKYGELLEVTGGQRRLHAYLEERGMPEEERDELVPRLHERKTELFKELVREGKLSPRPGAAELIDELEEAGIRLAVATTGSREWVEPLLDRLYGPLDRFEVVIGGNDVPERKPDPSAYHITLERLGLGPSAVVAVEDSRNGLDAARAAGVPCVMVVTHYTRNQELEDADLVLDGFGLPDEPAEVLHDRHHLEPPGRLDLETLRRLAQR